LGDRTKTETVAAAAEGGRRDEANYSLQSAAAGAALDGEAAVRRFHLD
jgi:hypothetical protein